MSNISRSIIFDETKQARQMVIRMLRFCQSMINFEPNNSAFRATWLKTLGDMTLTSDDLTVNRRDKLKVSVLGRCPPYMELSLHEELTAHQNNTYFFQSEICPVAQTVVHLLMMWGKNQPCKCPLLEYYRLGPTLPMTWQREPPRYFLFLHCTLALANGLSYWSANKHRLVNKGTLEPNKGHIPFRAV